MTSLRQAGSTAGILATTAPWWLVRRAHAARQHKLVVWNPAALAPQVDKIMQEQCYAYAKEQGIKDNEIDYSIMGTAHAAQAGGRSKGGIGRILSGRRRVNALYRSQGHLLDVTDVVDKMQRVPGWLFPISEWDA